MSNDLKAEIYDLRQELTKAQDVVQSYSHCLMKIANLLKVEPNEQGVIDLEDIVKTVTVLTSDAVV